MMLISRTNSVPWQTCELNTITSKRNIGYCRKETQRELSVLPRCNELVYVAPSSISCYYSVCPLYFLPPFSSFISFLLLSLLVRVFSFLFLLHFCQCLRHFLPFLYLFISFIYIIPFSSSSLPDFSATQFLILLLLSFFPLVSSWVFLFQFYFLLLIFQISPSPLTLRISSHLLSVPSPPTSSLLSTTYISPCVSYSPFLHILFFITPIYLLLSPPIGMRI